MNFILQPWHLIVLFLAAWDNREQQDVINHLRIENEILKEKLGKKRILLNDDQRRRLAVSGKILGRKLLEEVGDVLAAIDFTTVEVWTKGGLVTFYLLFAMELKTRRVHLAACTASLGDDFMKQIARNLTDPFDGFLKDKKYVLMDRDSHFSDAFRTILDEAGVKPVRLPPKSPNLNSHLERFFRSLKSEALDRMIFFGEKSLRRAVDSYLDHYHQERNHQGLNNQIIDPNENVGAIAGKIECRERLGGILKYYHRAAA